MSMPRILLHLEGAAVFVFCLALYHAFKGSWGLFALLILAPDLSMLGYLINQRVGSILYNCVHTYLAPLALTLPVYLGRSELGLQPATAGLLRDLALIWAAHIGMDRMLGFGLKYPTAFKDTHLQRV